MAQVKLTIRQINGALAALKAADKIPELQKELELYIKYMLENKKQYIKADEGKYVDIILELNDMNSKILASQRKR